MATESSGFPLPEETVEEVSRTFKALGDPTRIRILHLLSRGEASVGRIAGALSLSPSAVSHQLAYLRNLRLVKYRRKGSTYLYSCLDDHVLALLHQTIRHVEHG
ncbi:ArsR family transcriptional regulator [Melghirimyces profundicolus]|uniref:ArsR family transcriptional regulator n=1 Tax=Melghirimyces profundicolus TaxID=1242148 RepID=A0A2T6BH09_9BACL|nr:metalloregulator ArsR/SmtB family transcription factor [Melghirimyces profundicolus]PTX55326.1 ArsR family transcriptional regulator [Melghirimyces profundicolus]